MSKVSNGPYRDAAPTHAEGAQREERGSMAKSFAVESAVLGVLLLVPVIFGVATSGRVGVAETLCLLGAILFLGDTWRWARRRSRRF